jgi:hypothetical protein
MIRRAALVLGVLLCVLYAPWLIRVVAPIHSQDRVTHPATLEEVVPVRAQAAIRRATNVEAILTRPHLSAGPPDERISPDSLIHGYPIRSAPVRISSGQASELVELLMNRRNYQNEWPPCLFQPNVAYRFQAPRDTLDVLVCLGCESVLFVETDSTGSAGCAISIRDRLSTLTRSIFPGDSIIAEEWREDVRAASLKKARTPWWAR